MKKFLIPVCALFLIVGSVAVAKTNQNETVTPVQTALDDYTYTGRDVSTVVFTANSDYVMYGQRPLYINAGNYYLSLSGTYFVVRRNAYSQYKGQRVSQYRYMCIMKDAYTDQIEFFNM